jgi:hypothetical protein
MSRIDSIDRRYVRRVPPFGNCSAQSFALRLQPAPTADDSRRGDRQRASCAPITSILLAGFVWALAWSAPAVAQSSPEGSTLDIRRELIIGTKDAPPFAMQSPDGKWRGVGIELWRHVAKKLHLSYRFEEAKRVARQCRSGEI